MSKKRRYKKHKSSSNNFIERIKNNGLFSDDIIIIENKKEKMSEVILEFAKPLLNKCRKNDEFQKIISFSIIVWNLCLLPKQEQEKNKIEILNRLCQNYLEARDFWNGMIKMLIDRKGKYFSNDLRLIVDYEIRIKNGQLFLSVASVPKNEY